jgi:hypothetical protein
MTKRFLEAPGRPGPFGALLDETARAAEDFCRAVEGFSAAEFTAERASDDPDTASVRRIALHVCRAARGYANYVREALGAARDDEPPDPTPTLLVPSDVRAHLGRELRYTEATLLPLLDADYAAVRGLEFEVRWGPRYDPEMILEHGVCHLLRHRRQLERWER